MTLNAVELFANGQPEVRKTINNLLTSREKSVTSRSARRRGGTRALTSGRVIKFVAAVIIRQSIRVITPLALATREVIDAA